MILCLSFPGWSDPGESLTRNTARLTLLGYGVAVTLMLLLRAPDFSPLTPLARSARRVWTFACLTYLVHLAVAFHYYHHWSHQRAMQHVEEGSGFGPGIFFSYLFTLVWIVDVGWWWVRPAGYARRPAWVGRVVHGYLAFIVFNGTVVFASGAVRWAGVVLFAVLAALLFRTHGKERAL
jgi:hypothetical protein